MGYKLKGSWVLVKTGGRYPGARGGGDRSWLLIKHRDDWSGDLDIAEFAPRSVKSDGDFEDILARGQPGHLGLEPPAKGGDTGAAFEQIIARAAEIKAARTGGAKSASTAHSKTTNAAERPKKKAGQKSATPTRKSAAKKK